jgi:hypothetical protein
VNLKGFSMSYSQAFSDAEIITIAAVAATALGGVVIGLGRGQARHANDRHRLPDPHKLTRDARRQFERHTPASGEIVERLGHGAKFAIEEARKRVPADRPALGFAARRPVLKFNTAPSAAVAASLRDGAAKLAAQLSVPESIAGASRSVRSRASGPSPWSNGGIAVVRDHVDPAGWLASALSMIQDRLDARGRRTDTSGPLENLQSEFAAVSERLSDTPEAVHQARERARDEFETRVARPVSHAAATTRDVAEESLAAAAWLAGAAALVYFGLLSTERREQVKSALCGAVEQVRLLALDLQGYESEM